MRKFKKIQFLDQFYFYNENVGEKTFFVLGKNY